MFEMCFRRELSEIFREKWMTEPYSSQFHACSSSEWKISSIFVKVYKLDHAPTRMNRNDIMKIMLH